MTLETTWTGQVIDRSFFTAPMYEPYRRPGQIKVPFWLQPDTDYAGAAWCQRDVAIPEAWKGRRVVLSLGRPHWETRVWVDGRGAGANTSLPTPHEYDLGVLDPGRHVLTIHADNRLIVDAGIHAHSVSDHTQDNGNGIVGQIAF